MTYEEKRAMLDKTYTQQSNEILDSLRALRSGYQAYLRELAIEYGKRNQVVDLLANGADIRNYTFQHEPSWYEVNGERISDDAAVRDELREAESMGLIEWGGGHPIFVAKLTEHGKAFVK